jgi:hypothetical protein
VVDARGRSMPTSYRPRQQPASPPPPAVLDDEETQEDNEKTVAPVSVQPVDAPVQPASPVVGDVLQQIAQGMDEAGTFEEVERIKRLRAMEGVRIGWLRFAERHTPDAWSEGVGPEQLAEVARDCDRLITWLERAREAARQALGPRRVEA